MKIAVVFSLLFSSLAQASVEVTFPLSSASSNVLAQVLFDLPATVMDAKCLVEVTRPIGVEPPIETDHQEIVCSWNDGKKSKTHSFKDSKIDSWGQRSDPRSFEVIGPAAQALFTKFQKRTVGLDFPTPTDSIWARGYLCDSFGVDCLQTIFLSTEALADAPAQIACSRDTRLTKPSTVALDPNRFQIYPDFLDALVNLQIQEGHRQIDKVACVFLAPSSKALD